MSSYKVTCQSKYMPEELKLYAPLADAGWMEEILVVEAETPEQAKIDALDHLHKRSWATRRPYTVTEITQD